MTVENLRLHRGEREREGGREGGRGGRARCKRREREWNGMRAVCYEGGGGW